MSQNPCIAIVLEGGLVSDVIIESWPHGQPLPRFVVVDHDTELAAKEDLVTFSIGSEICKAACHSVVPNHCESLPASLSPRILLEKLSADLSALEHAEYDRLRHKCTTGRGTADDLARYRVLGARLHDQRPASESERLPGIEVVDVAVVTTGHVTRNEAKVLDTSGYGRGEYGWLIHIGSPGDPVIPEIKQPSAGLAGVIRAAREHGCTYLLFDRDGSPVAGVETYNW